MSREPHTPATSQGATHATLRSYVTGYLLSLLLTVEAYLLVVHHSFSKRVLVGTIVGLALTQFVVQLRFFLHLGRETKPRWKLLAFVFMIIVVAILVFGSLWIMSSLNNRMSPGQMDKYLKSQYSL